MADHDQRMKTAVHDFLAEFADLVMPPSWAARFEFEKTQWLEQDVFPDPPEGERRQIDLLARVPVTQLIDESNEALIHIEVDSRDSLTELRAKMPRYHAYLGYKYNLPILSLGLYMNVGLEGVGWDSTTEVFWEETLGHARWRYLGLPALDALQYVEGSNILGVAFSVQMRVPEERKPWLKARALTRIAEAKRLPQHTYILMTLVEAYLPLDGPLMQEYQRLMLTEEFTVARTLEQTTYEKGIEKGEESGRRKLLREQLEELFGPLSETARQRLEAASLDRLQELSRGVVRGKTLVELGLEDARNGNPASP